MFVTQLYTVICYEIGMLQDARRAPDCGRIALLFASGSGHGASDGVRAAGNRNSTRLDAKDSALRNAGRIVSVSQLASI